MALGANTLKWEDMGWPLKDHLRYHHLGHYIRACERFDQGLTQTTQEEIRWLDGTAQAPTHLPAASAGKPARSTGRPSYINEGVDAHIRLRVAATGSPAK